MVFQNKIFKTRQGLLDREGLVEDINTILVVCDHLFESANLTSDDLKPSNSTPFMTIMLIRHFVIHASTIPPGGIGCQGAYPPTWIREASIGKYVSARRP